jgi:putative ABC transport system ATP-binding protein
MTKDLEIPAVEVTDLQFSWSDDGGAILDFPDLKVERSERLFISGVSGSGKSTLLGLLAGINTPQQGSVSLLGKDITHMTGSRRDQFRADHIGYIFQMFNLVPYLSVIENVTLPLRFSQRRLGIVLERTNDPCLEARRLLEHLRLDNEELINRPVTDLSVGQQQRVAAARALIGNPEALMADEPTSSLDADNKESFITLLFEECAKEKTTLIFVSHDESLAHTFDRTLKLQPVSGNENRGAEAKGDAS